MPDSRADEYVAKRTSEKSDNGKEKCVRRYSWELFFESVSGRHLCEFISGHLSKSAYSSPEEW